jgi:chemotaxis receptor (MCP) glutamine deamidase CheD
VNGKATKLAGGTMINIGEIRITEKADEIVWSVLGSCVSIIFRADEKLSLLCHAQMPYRKEFGSRCADSCPKPCYNYLPDSMELKYVTCSIEYMIHYGPPDLPR